MKKMMTLAMMMVMTISANAMSYKTAKKEALFLSDKMAYELMLTDAQYDAVYEINLDYLMSINSLADVSGIWWDRRNADLRYVLTGWQYDKYRELTYFYRPVTWNAGNWTFHVYTHHTDRHHFYKPRPSVYASYRGGNNHKPDRFYADRNVHKPAPDHRNGTPHPGGNGATWRNPGNNSRPGNGATWRITSNDSRPVSGGSNHTGSIRQTAHNSGGSRTSGNFGGSR